MHERDLAIDVIKGILAVIFVITHLFEFFPGSESVMQFARFADLIVFTGYMFCSGFACYIAYLEQQPCWDARKRVLSSSVRILVCYYISAFAYQYFIVQEQTAEAFKQILTFRSVPGFSEFLLTFFCLHFLIFLLMKPLHTIVSHDFLILICILISFASVRIQAPVGSNGLIGTLVGGSGFYYFPLLQYSCVFWIGVYLSKHRRSLDKWVMLFCLFGFSVVWIAPERMIRFPPTLYWIAGGFAFVYLFYAILRPMLFWVPWAVVRPALIVGRHSLALLVISNVYIFRMWAITQKWVSGYEARMPGLYFTGFFVVIVLWLIWVLAEKGMRIIKNRKL